MSNQLSETGFVEFFNKVAYPMRMPPTALQVLTAFVNVDVKAEAISEVIKKNQYFEYMLVQQIQSLGLKENTPSLKAAIVLLGMQGVRDFTCAFQMVKKITKDAPKPGKDGKLDFKPKDILKFAIRTEEVLNTRHLPYPDTGYAAGMLFDILKLMGAQKQMDKTFDEYIEEIYKHGMKTARIALDLSKGFRGMGDSKFLFSSCLIHDIGKIVMELMYPPSDKNSYQAFRESFKDKPLPREVVLFIEDKKFGFTHDYCSSQVAYHSETFKSVEKALLCHHNAYFLKSAQKEIYQLAGIMGLATNIANHFRIPKDINDPIFTSWLRSDLKDFKFDRPTILQVLQKLPRDLS